MPCVAAASGRIRQGRRGPPARNVIVSYVMAWRPLGQTPLTIPFRGRCRRASGQNVGVSTAAALRWSLWQASRSRRGALEEQSKAEGGASRYRLYGLFAKILASAANWGTFFGPSFGIAGRSHFGDRLSLNVTKTSKGQRAVPIWGSPGDPQNGPPFPAVKVRRRPRPPA